MQIIECESCQSCSRTLVDAGDELVCPACGAVTEKAVVEARRGPAAKLPLFGRQPLGSFMGTREMTEGERHSKVSGDNTSYGRMKLMSDHTAREGSSADCGRLIERVGERLFLPRVVILQAATIAKGEMTSPYQGRRRLVNEVSAYALVAACKVEGVTSVSIREILAAYSDLGKRVTSSSIFRLCLESDVKTFARRPDEYLPKVIAKLSTNARLGERLASHGTPPTAYLHALRLTAEEILRECDRTALYGKRPCALAASAVYAAECLLAAREERRPMLTQRECSECGDTAEYTVREQSATLFMPIVARLGSLRRQTLPLRSSR